MRTLVAAALLCSTACTTTMISSWKKPGAGPINFKRIAVIAPVKDEGMRRAIEDDVVKELGLGRAAASYTLVPGNLDREQLKAQLSAAGFDGAVAVRIASVDKEAEYVGAPVSYGFGAWPYYDDEYVTVDTYVRVETHIYSLPDGELIFAATSRTVNPTSTTQLVDETVKAVRKELQKEGLLEKPVASATSWPRSAWLTSPRAR